MNINKKLSSTLIIILFFLILSFMLYFVMTSPIIKMKSEEENLIRLRAYIDNEFITLGKFIYDNIDSATNFYREAATDTKAGFENLAGISLLIDKSDTIKDSIEMIANIEVLIDLKRESLLNSAERLKGTSLNLSPTSNILEISNIIYKMSNAVETQNKFKTDSYDLINDIESMYYALSKSKQIIDEQFLLIDIEISRLKFRSQLISIIIGLLVTAFGIFLSQIVTRHIIKVIEHIDITTKHLKNRDLTNRYEISSKDELGSLSDTLNTFLDSLCLSIEEIKLTSDDNIQIKDQMMNSFEDSRVAIDQINSNIREVSSFTDKLNKSVHKSEFSISEIISFISRVQMMIEEESSMVEESSASINQIISTVNSISETVEKNQNTAQKLVSQSELGYQKINITNKHMKDITDSISEIKGMSDLIEDISEKTNLLSMNAAIEAAHAGDAGKGFSVVADEIRKLAEASSRNSKTIALNIKNVIDNIEKADISSKDTAESFIEIKVDIANVSSRTSEVLQSMNELRSGGGEVQSAISRLQKLTSDLHATSNEMTSSTRNVDESLFKLKNITGKVHEGNRNIESSMDTIQGLVKAVSVMGDKMNTTSKILDNELNKFQTINTRCI